MTSDTTRHVIAVRGVVQGVGFRPFVHAVATRLGIVGFVTNRGGDVAIEAEGPAARLDELVAELRVGPPASRVESVVATAIAVRGGDGFEIAASEASGDAAVIAPDVATCAACVDEIFDARGRRFGYAFTSCAACGPRLTIVTGAPYDRERTTMAPFTLCDECAHEMADPADRRFHAQPIACPACGPTLRFDREGDALSGVVAALRDGAIVAIKGLGGYHLACDALRADVVARLRERKDRDAKPFAIMVASIEGARELAMVSDVEAALLASSARPIVLLAGRVVPDGIAPGLLDVGVMLPYTPLHHLLLRAFGGPLVVTSGNASDEPIAFADDDARARLGPIADAFLVHDREIHARCDDSVTRVVDGAPTILRRARGYAPVPLRLPHPLAVPTLALGGHLKATFALGDGDTAFVSPHIGDLDYQAALDSYRAALSHHAALHRVTAVRVAHDLHPDYATTRIAEELGLPRVAVQHHHAHFASALADARVTRAIGVIFDGAGLGTDGTIWGGELLVGDAAASVRAGHLREVALPGGDAAAREPWRMGVVFDRELGLELEPWLARYGNRAWQVARLCASAVKTTSAGRLFDAVAAQLGLADVASFEAHAAMRLEALARSSTDREVYPVEVARTGGSKLSGSTAYTETHRIVAPQPVATPMVMDTLSIMRAVQRDRARGVEGEVIARRFHSTLIEMIACACTELAAEYGVADVVLSGGVFQNVVLANELPVRLRAVGLRAHQHRAVPANDGGLALGQLATLAALDARDGGTH
ncbi:MAG TPA: carbamoyltransferase HypF [Kofleriaceae bacterium]|jgi:hydrogenase maturation protein HypF